MAWALLKTKTTPQVAIHPVTPEHTPILGSSFKLLSSSVTQPTLEVPFVFLSPCVSPSFTSTSCLCLLVSFWPGVWIQLCVKLISGRILLVTYLAKSHLGCSVLGPGLQQLATTPATSHLLQTEAIQGSGFSPRGWGGKGGGRHFLTHDQITPLPPFTPCSPVLACFFLPVLGPSASPSSQLSFVGATPGFHHTQEPHPNQVCVSGFTRKGLEKRR